ncbi:sensor domain-containing diguanylate cyclase [Methylobacterium dankookense]|uniref:Putative signaling protein n=1 Tax=Methylobacterium dankookense TaxID=560405 RepID=A0A564FZJ0_9HYPH|nr:sensor domain-containing diguanylate cyclase [Methylobacterium dankookense]GJD56672.1 hypothetical protein IFDJLNFL_2569 [Methylobacterium dankookense]VUF13110.1 putative signaling protein [Methylobacterium dankookense]
MSHDAVPDPSRPRPALPCGLSLVRGVRLERLATLCAEVEARNARSRDRPHGPAAEAVAAAGFGVFECRLADESLTWTDAVYDLFGLPRGTALRRGRALDHYPPDSLAMLERVRAAALAARRGFDLDAEIVTAQGQHRWIRISASVACADGVPVRLFGLKRDVTAERQELERLRMLAERDALTGLANRAVFEARLAALGGRGGGALLLVDLDRFKPVNDGHGHAVGDACLAEMAARIRRVCAETCAEARAPMGLVARIGGDEFAVLLEGLPDPALPERLAARIVAALAEPVRHAGLTLQLGASVGIARQAGCEPAELFARADGALYAAKAAARNTFRSFDHQADPAPGARRVPRAALVRL